jgi:hypothetical protein
MCSDELGEGDFGICSLDIVAYAFLKEQIIFAPKSQSVI